MIHIKNLYFSYEQSSYILKDLNFSIQDGCYISILGENGSGKSTFIKLLLKLLIPTSGYIENTFKKTAYVPQR
ncbi:MAG: ATP-binding cassette domain-containing protein, partial [Selenomonadaceae bacterium]